MTDQKRAERVTAAALELETVKEIFIISEQTGKACTPFQQLLLDNGDGKKIYLNFLKKKKTDF